jgi:hypothetical protein
MATSRISGSLRGLRVGLIDDVATTEVTTVDASVAVRGCGATDVRRYAVAVEE